MPSAGGSPAGTAGGGATTSSRTATDSTRLTGASMTLLYGLLASANASSTSSITHRRHCQPNSVASVGSLPASPAEEGRPRSDTDA